MSSQIPMEYVMFQKKLGMEMSRALGEDMSSFYIIGSSADSTVFPGVSDVNYVLVLADPPKLSAAPADVIQRAVEVFREYRDNPMFTTLVDFEVLFESEMPSDKGLGAFKPLRAVALKNALVYSAEAKKFVADNNPYSDLEVDKELLRSSALTLVTEHLTTIASALAEPVYDDPEYEESRKDELEFLSIEAVLLATQAYYMVKKGSYVSKVDLAYMAEEEKLEEIDVEFLKICTLKKQGADYAGGYTESDNEDEVLDTGKGVIYQIEDMPEKTMNYLASISSLIVSL